MKITRDFSEFEPWCDAIPVWNRINDEGKLDTLEAILEDSYDGAIDEGELNDLLRFESDTVYGWLGMRTESEIRDEITEKKEEIEEHRDRIEEIMEEMEEIANADDIDTDEYGDKRDGFSELSDLTDELREVHSELEELEEELKELEEELEEY
jgi:DNA repair exonuclease SbcCD ATPase subunit